MQMHYPADRDENMKVAHHGVRPNMFPQQSFQPSKEKEGASKATEGQFSWTAAEIAQGPTH